MPITSTSGFDISSDTCCSPISASPLETSTLTRPLGPPAASLTFGVTCAAMPSCSEHALDMRRRDAAAGGRGVAHGLCREQRALERFGRRHVGLGRALAHGDADAGAREVDAAAHDLALLDEVVDRRAVGQEDVDGFAAVKAGDQRAGRRIARADGVAVRALEGRQQFVRHRLDRGRDERVDLGGPGRPGRNEQSR